MFQMYTPRSIINNAQHARTHTHRQTFRQTLFYYPCGHQTNDFCILVDVTPELVHYKFGVNVHH